MGPMGSSSATGHYVEPMVSSSQCATAGDYVTLLLMTRNPQSPLMFMNASNNCHGKNNSIARMLPKKLN